MAGLGPSSRKSSGPPGLRDASQRLGQRGLRDAPPVLGPTDAVLGQRTSQSTRMRGVTGMGGGVRDVGLEGGVGRGMGGAMGGGNSGSRLSRQEPKSLSKVTRTKRPQFNSFKQRITGTELEQYYKKTGKSFFLPLQPPPPPPPPRSNWRLMHENLINTIENSRQTKLAIAKGLPLPPPPPPALNPDYITCESCGRRFNPAAAQRHIPYCKAKALDRSLAFPVGGPHTRASIPRATPTRASLTGAAPTRTSPSGASTSSASVSGRGRGAARGRGSSRY